MNLIDRYVHAVGENLPRKSRADIEAEIRSLLEDTLEERSQSAGRPADEAMQVEVLKEFGSPEKMAASYLPPRYLIGPRLFPIFWLVIRIVAIVITVLAMIGLGVDLSQPGLSSSEILALLGQGVIDYFTSILAALGNVVFVFAIIEWLMPKTNLEQATDWDPRKLQAYEDPERVQPVSLIVEIIFTVIAILFFNLYVSWLGFPFMVNGKFTVVPFFTEAFLRYVPLFNVLWVLEIALNAFLLRAGRWQTWTRWASGALKGFSVVILVMMITGPAIIGVNLSGTGIEPQAAGVLERMATTAAMFGLVVALIAQSVDLVKSMYRLVVRQAPVSIPGE